MSTNEFQRKSRAGLAFPPRVYPPGLWPTRASEAMPLPEHHALRLEHAATRAIAKEEGWS